MNTRPFKDFHGDIDSFLKHCEGIDPEQVNNDDVLLNHEELVDTISEDYHVSKEEADKVAMEIKLDIVKEVMQELMKKGMLEILDYDEEGEPRYQLTELGRKYYENI